MKVTALVVWPINVEIEVDESENISDDVLRERLLEMASEIIETSTIHTII